MAYPKDNRLVFELMGTIPKSESKFIQIQRAKTSDGKEFFCVGEAVRYVKKKTGEVIVKAVKVVTIPWELRKELLQYIK